MKRAGIVGNSKGKYFLHKPDNGDMNDIGQWVNSYIDSRVLPIKNKVSLVLGGLKARQL